MAPTGVWNVSASSRLAGMADEKVAAYARAGCPDAAEYLLKKYRGFVEGKARSYFLAGAEQDDVVQEGMIGLYKAIRDFRAEKLANFRSFAELCVTRHIITAVKSASRNKHAPLNDYISFQQSCGDDETGGCIGDLLADVRAADPQRIFLDCRDLEVARCRGASGLSTLEHEVWQRYLDGGSYLEMAAELRLASKTIDNALQRAKRKVGRKLSELN